MVQPPPFHFLITHLDGDILPYPLLHSSSLPTFSTNAQGIIGSHINVNEALNNAVEDQDDQWTQPYLALAMMFSGMQTTDDVLSSGLLTTATTNDGQKNTVGVTTNAANVSAGVEERGNNDEGIEKMLITPYDAETIAYVFLKHFGFESKDSPTYLALWQADKSKIMMRQKKVKEIVSQLIKAVEKYYKEVDYSSMQDETED